LYGRGKVLRFVADGLDRSRDRDTPPVVLLIGSRGSGMTMLLDRIETGHRTGSPTARLDFGRNPDANPAAVMLDIGSLLSPGVARVGKVKLPLLGIGLIAVSLDPENEASPAEQLDQRLSARVRLSGRVLGDLAKQAGTLLPSHEQQAVVAEVATVLGWTLDGISRRRVGEHLAWYAGTVGRGNGTRLGPLLRLYERWHDALTHDDTDARRDVWQALCAALLADLRAGFNQFSLTHGHRTTNCLLLLDNVDSTAGMEFLETLADCRRRITAETDPLLVVAAQRTRPELQPAVGPPAMSTEEGMSYATWLAAAREQEDQPSPWYPVLLTDLSVGNVTSMVHSRVLGKAWRDVDFVHTVGGGHPVAVQVLAKRLARAARDFDPRNVLTREVEDDLLGKLRPAWLRDRELEAMAVYGAAFRPRLKAGASVFRSLRWAHINEMDVSDLFLSLLWAGDEGWLVVRPLPRLLLSRLLARDGDLWNRTHDGFLTHYRTRDARDTVAEQYHLLALTTSLSDGNLGKVAAHLDQQLDIRGSSEWNDTLVAITAAPNRLRHSDDDRRAAGDAPDFCGDAEDVVKRLADVTSPGERLRTVTRLVTARWLYNDRLFDPVHRLARLLAREYYELAQLTGGASEVCYREASYFRKVARDWEDRS